MQTIPSSTPLINPISQPTLPISFPPPPPPPPSSFNQVAYTSSNPLPPTKLSEYSGQIAMPTFSPSTRLSLSMPSSSSSLLKGDILSTGKTNYRELEMDSQFQLHQEMIIQNNYMLRKTENTEKETQPISLGDLLRREDRMMMGLSSSSEDTERVQQQTSARSSRKRSAPTMSHSPTQYIQSVLSIPNVCILFLMGNEN